MNFHSIVYSTGPVKTICFLTFQPHQLDSIHLDALYTSAVQRGPLSLVQQTYMF